jgi:hypothetical protein
VLDIRDPVSPLLYADPIPVEEPLPIGSNTHLERVLGRALFDELLHEHW